MLGDCAAAVLMKILYGARMGRYDLIRPVQALASLITKWDGLCDKKLHRLVCYINSTLVTITPGKLRVFAGNYFYDYLMVFLWFRDFSRLRF